MLNNIIKMANGDFKVEPLSGENVIIWSKNGCGYCQMAKKLLTEDNYKFEERNIDGECWSMDQLMEIAPEIRTMPQIFMDGKHIGGYDDLDAYLYLKKEK